MKSTLSWRLVIGIVLDQGAAKDFSSGIFTMPLALSPIGLLVFGVVFFSPFSLLYCMMLAMVFLDPVA